MQFINNADSARLECVRQSILGWMACTDTSKFVDYRTARKQLKDSINDAAFGKLAVWVGEKIGQTTAVKIGMWLGEQSRDYILKFGEIGARKQARDKFANVIDVNSLWGGSCAEC